MEETVHFDAEYFNQTTVHPVGLSMLLLMGALVILLPRRWALVPVIFIACFVAPGQRVVLAGLDFTFLRLLVMMGWIRLMMLGEYRNLVWKPLDTALVVWAFIAAFLGTLSGGHDNSECVSALIYEAGRTYDAIGGYFLFRCLVRDWNDFDRVARSFIYISFPVLAIFLVEFTTQYNLFSVFGGVREFTWIREGRLRCQGAFAHPILAGCFWASVVPLMATQWWRGRRMLTLCACLAGLALVVLCSSSTPVMGVGFAMVAAMFFPFRKYMRLMRWTLFVGVVALQLAMSHPVYHLIGRITVVGGSTGYHRYRLIDRWLEHANEWWLIGSSLGSDHWGDQLFDVTNYYVALSLQGGLPLLIAFIIVLAVAFGSIGRTWRKHRDDRARTVAAWALGVSLMAHVAMYIGVTYFGQIIILWYLLLAMIGSLSPGGFLLVPSRVTSRPIRHRDEIEDEEPDDAFDPDGGEPAVGGPASGAPAPA